MDLDIRPVEPEELHAYLRSIWTAFSEHPTQGDLDSVWETEELDRTLAVFDRGQIVGSTRAYSYELTLPGLTFANAAGVTSVGVLPTHRRRGVLRSMMRRQLTDVRDRGEPLAILGASESLIYGRFGYGMATRAAGYEIETAHVGWLREPAWTGRVRLVDKDEATKLVPELFDQARRHRPGEIDRSPGWWAEYFRDSEHDRRGAGPWFFVVYESGAGGLEGYAAYRVKDEWIDGFSQKVLRISDGASLSAEAQVALWDYCLHVDLIKRVRTDLRPLDEPLVWMLDDPRRLRAVHVRDDLWVRLVDLPAALAARRYPSEGALVLSVSDSFFPENDGSYLIEGGPEGAECKRTDGSPDLSLSVADLGAAYLGGVRFATLARAGRAEELTPGSLARADAMFTCEPQPWCATHF